MYVNFTIIHITRTHINVDTIILYEHPGIVNALKNIYFSVYYLMTKSRNGVRMIKILY